MANMHENRAAASLRKDPDNIGKDLEMFTQFPKLQAEMR